jgi:biopolymer transport protein ExbB
MKTVFTGFAGIVIPVLIVVAILVYFFVMGNPQNFQGNNINNMPKPGNYLGIIYKGGIIVPVLMSILLMVITFSIERWITITKAKGKGSGSVANVIKAGLLKYRQMIGAKDLNKDQKIVAIKQEIEEATSLELPILEQNLVILATIAPLATLVGLFGTVLGMIKAFAALATAGAPDAVALATGISEALINTAFGIGSSAIAIITYNYFTTKIDKMTYSIDEAGVAIVQNFASHYN